MMMGDGGHSRERPRVLVVVGTRPEAIKMAPVLEALRSRGDQVEARLALTGQHTEMVDQVLTAFEMTPDYDLEIMKEGQDLYDVAHGCLDGLRDVVRDFEPEMILVQGDTASVFYASLVAFLERVRVGHVEAGLRTHDKTAPYPEEMFRRLTDGLTDLHFAPTPRARENLLKEGLPREGIFLTGNTVVDAVVWASRMEHAPTNQTLRRIIQGGKRLVLLTAHRRESFGRGLREIFTAVRGLVDEVEDVELFYPVHPNPNVTGPAHELLGEHPRIHLSQPLDYLDLVASLKNASLVLTDSGGIQEEAPTFGVPVLVLREVTERGEWVEAGGATRLVGTRREEILKEGLAALRGEAGYGKGAGAGNPYGDGRAGDRIADIVVSMLAGTPRETTDWDGK